MAGVEGSVDQAALSEQLFAHHLRSDFQRLPAVLQRMHGCSLPARFQGEVTVEPNPLRAVRLLLWLLGLPREPRCDAIRLDIEATSRGQQWTRHFPGQRMRSRLRLQGDQLAERLGPVTLLFRLRASDAGIDWCPSGLRFLGMPLPLSWLNFTGGQERQSADGRYLFDAWGGLPLIGRLVRYHGWLQID